MGTLLKPSRRTPEPYAPCVLIVDDDQHVRGSFREILEEAGYFVTEASNGREALRAAADWFFEVLIVDLSMPDADGLEAIRSIRSELPGAKILAISGFMEGAMLSVAAKMGATATLNKSVAREQLLSKVCQLLE
ncbi:MAG TPA: response regulator transcription factor [Bryobacteraceae bacterium]|nr:response regulator transcription factor [Bryobacteraceae bacterium]